MQQSVAQKEVNGYSLQGIDVDLHALLDAGKLEIIDAKVAVSSLHHQQFDRVRVW